MQKNSREQLLQHEISPSFTRVKILEYIQDSKHHPTVDDIFSSLIDELPTLSKTTVYNVLNLFEEKNIVKSLLLDKTVTRYEMVEEEHAHFKCNVCGSVFDIPKPEIIMPTLRGFTIEEDEVTFKGTCSDCSSHQTV